MTAHARVLMMTPDLNRAIGGVKIHYQVVDALNRAGIEALIVHRTPGFRCSWFENTTRIVYIGELQANHHDVVVVPEEWVAFVPDLPPEIPKVIFHQNAYSTFSWGADATVVRDVLRRPDVKRAVVVSEDNAAYLRYAFPNLDVQRMRYTIDQSVFGSRPDEPKKRQIAYMPRRRFQEARDVLSILRCRDALAGWSVVAIDKMSEAEVARQLRTSAIFLSLSLREGLPLPPAEAMSCRCVVIGFHGFGGRDFGDHALWVPEGDVIEFAGRVESVLGTWDSDAEHYRSLTDRASAHIRDTYNAENTTHDVLKSFGFPIEGVTAGASVALSDSMWQANTVARRVAERLSRAARVVMHG